MIKMVICLSVMSLVLFAGSLGFLDQIIYLCKEDCFKQVEVKILSKKIKRQGVNFNFAKGGGYKYYPEIEYEYTVNGIRSINNYLAFEKPGGKKWAKEILDNYSIGSQYLGYYNPKNYSESILIKTDLRLYYFVSMFIALLISVFFLKFAILVATSYKIKKPKLIRNGWHKLATKHVFPFIFSLKESFLITVTSFITLAISSFVYHKFSSVSTSEMFFEIFLFLLFFAITCIPLALSLLLIKNSRLQRLHLLLDKDIYYVGDMLKFRLEMKLLPNVPLDKFSIYLKCLKGNGFDTYDSEYKHIKVLHEDEISFEKNMLNDNLIIIENSFCTNSESPPSHIKKRKSGRIVIWWYFEIKYRVNQANYWRFRYPILVDRQELKGATPRGI